MAHKVEIEIGKEVYWHDPDDGACSCHGTIVDIREDGTVVLGTEDGGITEALPEELDEP